MVPPMRWENWKRLACEKLCWQEPSAHWRCICRHVPSRLVIGPDEATLFDDALQVSQAADVAMTWGEARSALQTRCTQKGMSSSGRAKPYLFERTMGGMEGRGKVLSRCPWVDAGP